MSRTIILIWGGAIIIYLLIMHASGTKTVLSGLQSFVGGTTQTLQGR